MTMEQTEIIDTVFKRSENDSGDSFTKNNLRAFNILMALDGKRSVSQIAKDEFYEIDDLVEMIQQLYDHGIIEPAVTDASGAARNIFFEALEGRLGQIIGPVGSIIVQDTVSKSGHNKFNYPMANAPELIDLLSQEIGDEGEAQRFKSNMFEELKKMG